MLHTDQTILTDGRRDRELHENGIAVVPLLEASEVEELKTAYWQLAPDNESGIRLDYLRSDRQLVRELADVLDDMWSRVAGRALAHHRPAYSSFVVKHPGEDSAMFLHRDLAVVDERYEIGLSMWVPLEDVGPDLHNGTLEIVSGSHRIPHGAFGPCGPVQFEPFSEGLSALQVPLTMSAGDAAVYDAGLLHGSGSNLTAAPRLAVGCLLRHPDRPLVQTIPTGRRHRAVHHVDRDYFVDLQPADIASGGMPESYPLVDEFDEIPMVTSDTVSRAVGQELPPAPCIPPDRVLNPMGVPWKALTPDRVVDLPILETDLSISTVTTHPAVGSTMVRVDDATVGLRWVGPSAIDDLPREALDLLMTLVTPPMGAALAILDPGELATLTVLDAVELAVLECPLNTSGIVVGDGAVRFDLGQAFSLCSEQEFRVWNDGPGQCIVVLQEIEGHL